MQIRAWHIGEYGEIYAGISEDEVKAFLAGQIGQDEAAESLENCFEEIPSDALDREVEFEGRKTTLRKVSEQCQLPTQIATCYG